MHVMQVVNHVIPAEKYGGTERVVWWLSKKLAELDDELKLGGRTLSEEWVEQAKELLAGKPPRAKSDQKAAQAKK